VNSDAFRMQAVRHAAESAQASLGAAGSRIQGE
jgi:hypothetical protein